MEVSKNAVYVRGEASVKVRADLGYAHVTIDSTQSEREESIGSCNQESKIMDEAIKKYRPKEYSTGGMSLTANRQKLTSDDRWERKGPIISYTATQSFEVVFDDLEKIRKFISWVLRYEPIDRNTTSVDISKVYWNLSDKLRADMENKCRSKAVEISRERAEALVSSLNVELAKYPLYIVEDGAEVYGVRYSERRDEMNILCQATGEEYKEIGVEALEAREIRVSFGATVCWGFKET